VSLVWTGRLYGLASVIFLLCGAQGFARAQPLAPGGEASRGGARNLSEGGVVVGIERMTGVIGWHTRQETENDFGRFERSRWGAQLHVFGATAHVGDGRDAVNFSGIPRIALDFVLGSNLTLGGYASFLGSTGIEQLTVDDTKQADAPFPDVLTVLGGGRVGYALAVGQRTVFWPRVGFSYSLQRTHGEAGARQTIQVYQVSLEPTFVFSPIPNVGFLLHPIVDLGVAGSVKNSFVITGLPTQSSQGGLRAHATGVTAGLVVIF
jgi:hypothetical protein